MTDAVATKSDVQLILKELSSFKDEVNRRFEQVDKRFEQVDKRFEQVDKRFEQVERELDHLREEVKDTKSLVKEDKRKLQEVYDSRNEVTIKFSKSYVLANLFLSIFTAAVTAFLVAHQ